MAIRRPDQVTPELPGWEDRSLFVARHGQLSVDPLVPYSHQALAKIGRGHSQDTADVRSMVLEWLVEPRRTVELFEAIESERYRFPPVDARA